jgi:hypothetical protein
MLQRAFCKNNPMQSSFRCGSRARLLPWRSKDSPFRRLSPVPLLVGARRLSLKVSLIFGNGGMHSGPLALDPIRTSFRAFSAASNLRNLLQQLSFRILAAWLPPHQQWSLYMRKVVLPAAILSLSLVSAAWPAIDGSLRHRQLDTRGVTRNTMALWRASSVGQTQTGIFTSSSPYAKARV